MMERIKYIDTAKGILILMVVFLHVGYFYITPFVNGNNWLFLLFTKISVFTFMPYFMAAFFLLHGYCSHKQRSVKETFEYGCKTLIIPMVFLNLWHIHWFCIAMFGSMLIHSFMRRYTDKTNYIVYFIILLLSVAINKYGLDRFFISYTFAYAPFIFIGEKVRGIVDSNKFAFISLIICIIIWSTYFFKHHFVIPYIAGSAFRIDFVDIPIFLITTICGSSSLFLISRLLEHINILAELGKHSLVIYLFHFNIILFIEPKCIYFLDNADTIVSFVGFCGIFLLSLIGSYMFSILINKYIPWLIGKKWG